MSKILKFYSAVAILFGTVVGAGVFGIPFVMAKSGFLTGILAIVIIGAIVLTTNLCLGEVVLRTPGKHQLTGYAEIYLGKIGKFIMFFAMIFGIYGALIAYTIGISQSLNAVFGGGILFWGALFYVAASFIIFKGLKTIAVSELLLICIKSLTLLIIVVFSVVHSDFSVDKLLIFDLSKVLVPYGVILFAFLGSIAIPEMKDVLVQQKNNFKKAILIGSIL